MLCHGKYTGSRLAKNTPFPCDMNANLLSIPGILCLLSQLKKAKITSMRKLTFPLCAALLGSLLCTPVAGAGWDSLLEDTRKLEQGALDLGKHAHEFGMQALKKAKNFWDELEINSALQEAFGSSIDEQSALVGRFYDLKQPIDGKARPLSRHQVVDLFHRFNCKEWDSGLFSAYYSPKVKLYAPYFYLPRCKAAYGPKAFQCNEKAGEKQVKPSDWVVLYRGVVTAPESGYFRFVGMGDDVLMVRFNNKLVLESGWSIPTRNNMTLGTSKNYQREITSSKGGRALYQYSSTPHWNKMLGGIPTGTPFKVQQGKKYPIEILVSEIPGNEFGFCLLVEKLAHANKAPHGTYLPGKAPTLHLFRTDNCLPDFDRIRQALTADGVDYTVNNTNEGPPFLKDSLVWKADFDEAEKRGLFDRLFGKLTGSDKDTAMGTSHESDDEPETPKDSKSLWDSLLD